ncbi:ABC transporter ATP-binding protein [Pseudokineococcus sp. 1T1Z-3]|uniref:ABC transporter ATP-binding protein n=1 Tax=Pseudokineococcus sp. 1T1Z-3 TaxID=3132745 RepID=UPI0030B7F4F6
MSVEQQAPAGGAAAAHRSRARRGIDRDSLLREKPRLADVLAAARLLAAEVPRPRRSAAVLVGLSLLEVGATVVVALAGRSLLDAATGGTTGGAGALDTGALVVAVLAALGAFAAVRARLVLTEDLAMASRTRAVRRLAGTLHTAGVEDLSAVPMAGLREVLMTDVDAAYRFLLTTANQLTVLLFWAVSALAVVAWLSPPLLLLLLGLGLACGAALVQGTRRHLRLTGDRFVALARLSGRARDVVEVERVVLARQFGLGDLPVRQMMAAHEEYADVAVRQGRLTALVQALLLGLNSLSFVAVVGAGAVLVAGGDLGVGGLVAVVFVVGQLLLAVTRLGETSSRAAETATSGRRIAAYWDADAPPAPPRELGSARVEAVRARGLAFGWASGQLLADVDLDLERGRTTALTAATGAGKSTLAMLLTGLLPARAGTVSHDVDGEPLTPAELPAGRVLYVGARPVLVEGSLRDNLLLDDDAEVDDDVLRRAVAHITAGALPFDVDDVVVGPHGTGLSSGQGQLVQLVRAVWRDPDVLVLDEATSALDMATEERVQAGLLSWCSRRVCLVVSHRRCPWTDTAAQQVTLGPDPAAPGSLTVLARPAGPGADVSGVSQDQARPRPPEEPS